MGLDTKKYSNNANAVSSKISTNTNIDFESLIRTYIENQFVSDSNTSTKYMKVDDIPLSDVDENGNTHNMRLEKYFIDLKVQANSDLLSNRSSSKWFIQNAIEELNKIEPFKEHNSNSDIFNEELKFNSKPSRNWLLKGNAGQGKSTLIQFLTRFLYSKYIKSSNIGGFPTQNDAEEFIRKAQKFENLTAKNFNFLPFRILLSDYDNYYSNCTSDCDKGLKSYIIYQILGEEKKKLNKEALINFSISCWQFILNNNVIFLFDGFDEITQNKEGIKAEIDSIVEMSVKPNSRIFTITSTRRESSDVFSEKYFRIFNILDLEQDAVEEYINQYGEKFNEETRKNFKDEIMIKYLTDSDVEGLMKTPLEVTLICLVWDTTKKIPTSRVGLYTDYLNMYFTRAAKKSHKRFIFLNDDDKGSIVRSILYRVGYECAINFHREFTEKEILSFIEKENLSDDGRILSDWVNESKIVIKEALIEGLGLMVPLPNNNKKYSIINHASIAEFLAAKYFEELSDLNNNNESIIKLTYNTRYTEILKFILEIYKIKNQGKKSIKILKQLDDNIDEKRDYFHIMHSINLTSFHAARILSFGIFSDMPICQEELISKALPIIKMDIEDTDEYISLIFFIIYHISRAPKSIKNSLTKILLDELAKPNRTNNWFIIYENMISAGLLEDKMNIYNARKDYIQRYLMHYNENCDYKFYYDSFDFFNFDLLRAPDDSFDDMLSNDAELSSITQHFKNMLEAEFKENGIKLPNGYNIVSLKHLYVIEIVRNQIGQSKNTNYLTQISEYNLGLNDIKLKSHYNKIYIHRVKINEENVEVLNFKVAVLDDESRETAKNISLLCKENNLPGIAHIFYVISNFTLNSFVEFVRELYSGKYTQEINAVFGKFKRLKYKAPLFDHPVFIEVNNAINGKKVYDLESYKTYFDIYSGKCQLSSLTDALQAANTTPIVSEILSSGDDFTRTTFPLFIDILKVIENEPDEKLKNLYMRYLQFAFSNNEWQLHYKDDKNSVEQMLGIINCKFSSHKTKLIELVKWSYCANNYERDFTGYCQLINFLLYYADKDNSYNVLKQIDYAIYKEKFENYVYEIVRKNNPYTYNTRSSNYYLTIIDNLLTLFDGKENFSCIYYMELLYLIIMYGADEIKERNASIKKTIKKCKLKNYDAKILKIISLIIKWQKNPEISDIEQTIVNDIQDCAKNSPIINSWITYDLMFNFLQYNYKDCTKDYIFCSLISAIYARIPVDIEHAGIRQRYQKYLLSVMNNFTMDFNF